MVHARTIVPAMERVELQEWMRLPLHDGKGKRKDRAWLTACKVSRQVAVEACFCVSGTSLLLPTQAPISSLLPLQLNWTLLWFCVSFSLSYIPLCLHSQEPLSAALSALALVVQFNGWLSFFLLLYYKLPLRPETHKTYYEFTGLWHIYGLLAMNSWFWSAIYHSW